MHGVYSIDQVHEYYALYHQPQTKYSQRWLDLHYQWRCDHCCEQRKNRNSELSFLCKRSLLCTIYYYSLSIFLAFCDRIVRKMQRKSYIPVQSTRIIIGTSFHYLYAIPSNQGVCVLLHKCSVSSKHERFINDIVNTSIERNLQLWLLARNTEVCYLLLDNEMLQQEVEVKTKDIWKRFTYAGGI